MQVAPAAGILTPASALYFMPHCPAVLHEELLTAAASCPGPPAQIAVLSNSFRGMVQARQRASTVRSACSVVRFCCLCA